MALTDIAIRNARPGAKPVKLADGGGLHLLITPAGGKLWRLKYRLDGREKQLAIGAYPSIGLSEARRRRDEARELVAMGKDPSREKQRDKLRSRLDAANTFASIAKEYVAHRKRDGQKGWAPATASRSEYLLGLLPRGTHDYAKFIRPSELAAMCRSAGLAVADMIGMTYNPIARRYALTPDTSVNYIMHCRKE